MVRLRLTISGISSANPISCSAIRDNSSRLETVGWIKTRSPQAVGVSSGYYLFNAAPYVLTLGIMIATCSTRRALAGAPGELSINR